MKNILLLEDDPILANEVKDFIHSKNSFCEIAYDGEMFIKIYESKKFDIVLLDINVPKINGLELCTIIRQKNASIPILMTTAFGEIEDKSFAFSFGADDYLVKPFLLDEMWLRILALLRRNAETNEENHIFKIADLVIDTHQITVSRNGELINLTPKEYKLLMILIENQGNVLSKQQIADKLWDYYIETNHNTIEVYINMLRKKIDKNHELKLIHTKIGFGYYIKKFHDYKK